MNYSKDELSSLGLGAFGDDVLIDRSVRLYNPARIKLGSRVRIDCFVVITAGDQGVEIGNNVHVSAHAAIFGGGGRVLIEAFCGLSGRTSIYTSSDDYTEGYIANPTMPAEFRKCTNGAVVLRRHALIGAGTVILPNVELGIGSAVGALSLVRTDVEEFKIVAGIPAEVIGQRDRKRLLELEQKYLSRPEFAGGRAKGSQ